MLNRQINQLTLVVAVGLFCLGCDTKRTTEKSPSPQTEENQEQETNRPVTERESPEKPPTKPVVTAQDPSEASAKPGQPKIPEGPDNQPTTDEVAPGPASEEAGENREESALTEGEAGGKSKEESETPTISIPDNWVRLSQQNEIWIDMKAKQVMVGGQICLDRGGLEVFACPRQTKEHEAVISVNARALELHTCLIAIGADPGKPVQWTPDYEQATGPKIKIEVRWSEDDEEVTRNAKELVRNFDTKKELEMDWVFCGSQFYTNPEDGTKVYYGDSGEMICLSNFSTATLDLPIESSGSNESLLFEANTEKIPPV
ncbi:MAG: YdjY domain-containing protein, partial [Planctomycetota bacterium]|nr:YdjY domain-containing protein [Planctomycetota bacterium]